MNVLCFSISFICLLSNLFITCTHSSTLKFLCLLSSHLLGFLPFYHSLSVWSIYYHHYVDKWMCILIYVHVRDEEFSLLVSKELRGLFCIFQAHTSIILHNQATVYLSFHKNVVHIKKLTLRHISHL